MSLLSDEELIRTYPLKVGYPHGGRHFLLEWHTHGEQWRVLLTRSVDTMPRMLKVAMKFDLLGGLTLGKYLQVDIVAPPYLDQLESARRQHQSRIQDFWTDVGCNFLGHHPKTFATVLKPLPPDLKVCDTWESRYTFGDRNRTEQDDDEHFDCIHCWRRIRPRDGTLESSYLERKDIYEALYPRPAYRNKYAPTGVSRAEPAGEGQIVQRVSGSFGHHCSGSKVVDGPSDPLDSSPVVFYFTNPVEVIKTPLKNLLKQERAKQQKISDDLRKRQDTERKRNEILQANKVFQLFPSGRKS